ncbi:MAG: hypothetical protein ABL889_19385 [Terricaulis sp.]
MHPPPPISNHRLARLGLWLLALLAWCACGRIGERQRRRYGEVSLETLERAARNLIIIGAAQLLSPRKRAARRYHAKPARTSLRAIAGVWLRRRLRTESDLSARARHLLAVFRDWRVLAAELAHRRSKGLTRLAPIILRPEPTAPVCVLAFAAPVAADTS